MRYCPKDINNVPPALVGLTPAASSEDINDDLYKGEGVKDRIMQDQHGKCIFCECRLNGDYGPIEHFRPKRGYTLYPDNHLTTPGYYWLAYEWSNLLLSCSKCNTSYKKNLFLLVNENCRDIENKNISSEEPLLINPSAENPARYIEFHQHIVAAKTDINGENPEGRYSIDLLKLNDRPDLVKNRRRVWNDYQRAKKQVSLVEQMFERGINLEDARKLLALSLRSMAEMEGPEGEYSAMFIP